jgi:ATP-dependent DNA helicase UvrD/PcrA
MAVPKAVPTKRTFQPDEKQRAAIEHVHGPILVVAGAGTGKTTVLIRRIANLIRAGHALPDEILAVTYTDNAAKEMRERVEAELRGTNLDGLQVKTFHAYCSELLIRNGKKFGVLDDKDLWIYLRKRLPELHLNYFVRAANVAKFLDDLLEFMRHCQDELVGPTQYADYVNRVEGGELPIPRVGKSKEAAQLTDDEVLGRCHEIASVFSTVERMLQDENLGTFGHMITCAHDLLEQDPELLACERQRTRFILVDEFQDANFAQVKILQKIAGEEKNIFAVGDPDQAIYRFRGASSAAFQLFQHHFPGAKLVVLDRNRRSLSPILHSAFALIDENPPVFAPGITAFTYRRSPLISARDEAGLQEGRNPSAAPVEAVVLTAKDAEGSDVASTILQLRKQSHCRWKNFAVLYRTHTHRDDLVLELAERGIPFTIENLDVMNTPEARDLFAGIGAVVSEADGASLLRVAALPQFAIDGEKLRAGIHALPRNATSAGIALVLRRIEKGPVVLEALRQAREQISRPALKGAAAVQAVLKQFALDCDSPVIAAVLAFVAAWEKKPTTKTGELPELLEYLEYFREANGSICLPSSDEEDAVRLMTVHTAKGLEFDHVFILRAVSPSFPCQYRESLVEFPRELRDPHSMPEEDNKTLHGQEERRLFYVAMTRARDSLTIYAKRGTGKTDPTPPGYLRELLKDRSLHRWLRSRPARGFQTDMFAQSSLPAASGTNAWLSMPPQRNLSARLSASAVETYNTCPLQFKLDREWKIPAEVPAAMHYGAVMHAVLRSYFDSVRFGRAMPEEDLIALFLTNLRQAGIQEEYQYQLYEAQGIAQLKRFFAICSQSPAPAVLHTEEFFEIKIGEATVVGRIDRMDDLSAGRVAVTDYKTGKPKSQEDADDSLQLSIYALAAKEKWGYEVNHLAFYNLEENSAVITRRGSVELQAAKSAIEEVAAKISQGDFSPKLGFHCRFCAYKNLCPETEKHIYGITLPGRST